jgi:hypothetical protein
VKSPAARYSWRMGMTNHMRIKTVQ